MTSRRTLTRRSTLAQPEARPVRRFKRKEPVMLSLTRETEAPRRKLTRRAPLKLSTDDKAQVRRRLGVSKLTQKRAKALGFQSVQKAYQSTFKTLKSLKEERQARKTAQKEAKTQRAQRAQQREASRRVYHVIVKINVKGKRSNGQAFDRDYFKKFITRSILPVELKQEINNYMELFAASLQDSDLTVETTSIVNYQYLSENLFNTVELDDMKRMLMRRAVVAKFADMEGVDVISYGNYKDKCVYGILSKYLNIPEDELFRIFRDSIEDDDEDEYLEDGNGNYVLYRVCRSNFTMETGVDTRMIKALCVEKNIPLVAMDYDGNVFERNLQNRNRHHHYKPICYYVRDNHMYLVTDTDRLLSLTRSTEKSFVRVQFDDCDYETKEIAGEFVHSDKADMFSDTGKVIFYDKDDLTEELVEIYQKTQTVPKVSSSDKKIKKIEYRDNLLLCDANKAIDRGNHDFKKNKELAESLNFPFTNQSLSTLVNEYETEYFRPRRDRIAPDVKEQVLNEAMMNEKYKCAMCEKSFCKSKVQIDHILPVSDGGISDYENLQVLCIQCHQDKTINENEQGRKQNPALSSYNNRVKEIMESDLSKRWAFIETVKEPNKNRVTRFIDLNKTRRNILHSSPYDYPVFSVFDDVEEYDHDKHARKPGLFYIQTGQYMPLRGNGWYSWPMVAHCMKRGYITHWDVKYCVVASFTLAHDYYTKFIDSVLEKFGDVSKLAVNAFIGCMARTKNEKTKTRITASFEEACMMYIRNGGFIEERGGLFFLHETQTQHLDETRMPIYNQILDMEAIEMDKLRLIVEAHNGTVIHYNTDCIRCEFEKEEDVPDITLYSWWNGLQKYKFEEKEVSKSIIDRMKSVKRTNIYTHTARAWTIKTEEEFNDADNIVKHILKSEQSVHLEGRAGTGKSYIINALRGALDNGSYSVLAPTHKAALLVGGQTLHKFIAHNMKSRAIMKKNLKDVKVIIIDEISMMSERFYKKFLSLKKVMPHIRFILVGDFDQLQPVKDRYNGDYSNTAGLGELCDYNRICLTKCKRSDDRMYELCKDVNKVNPKAFPCKQRTMRNIAFTNEARKKINDGMMKYYVQRISKEKSLPLAKLPYNLNSQDVQLAVGMPVISYRNTTYVYERVIKEGRKERKEKTKTELFNNEEFTITKISKKHESITMCNDRTQLTIKIEDFQRLFYVAFCITVHKSQGSTFKEPYTIFEWERFDDRLKYVALSRATQIENIQIYK